MKINDIFKSRSLRYGSVSVILVGVVIAIAIIVNMLVGLGGFKWDLTANKMFSIGDTTKNILKGLNKDVEIYGLLDIGEINSNEDFKQIRDVLTQYEKFNHIKVQYVDPDKNPGKIKEIDPEGMKDIKKGDFVVKSGKKIRKLALEEIIQMDYNQYGQPGPKYFIGEQSFTGAIKYVTSEKTPVVYFTDGHKENKVDEVYKNVKGYLESNNYDVKTINLTAEAKVPEDTEILMIASPKLDLSVDEKQKVKEYLDNGGKAVFLFDSLETGTGFAQFDDILKNYNISLNDDKVKENNKSKQVSSQNPYAILLDVQKNQIVPENFQVVLMNSRSLNILKNEVKDLTVTSLMKSSKDATGEQIDKSKGQDLKGPLELAIAAEKNNGPKPSKVLVMGNSFFISDSAEQVYGPYYRNGMFFFLSSLNWMQDKKDDIVIEAKSNDAQKLEMDVLKARMTAFLLVIVLPIAILGYGMIVWRRRRHL